MKLSPIARAVNTLCQSLRPDTESRIGEPPPAAPWWDDRTRVPRYNSLVHTGFDNTAWISAPPPPRGGPGLPLAGSERFGPNAEFSPYSWYTVPIDWSKEFGGVVMPPNEPDANAYLGKLYAGEISTIIETRWIKDAGLQTRLIPESEWRKPEPRQWPPKR